MRKHRKMMALVAFMMAFVLLASCTGGGGSNSSSKPAETSKAAESSKQAEASTPAESSKQEEVQPDKYADHMDISVYTVLHPSANLEDFPEGEYSIGDNEYMERFNITINYTRVPNANQEENFNLMMASKKVTDVVRMENFDRMNKYQEAWMVIDPIVKDNPDYPFLNEKYYQNDTVRAMVGNDNGEYFVLPKLSDQYIGDTLLVREDLCTEWGIDISQYKTKEDFAELFKLVQEKSGGTITPYETRMKRAGLTQRLCEGFSGMKEDFYVDKNTMEVKFGVLEPDFVNVMNYIIDLYKQGLVDQEYPTTDTSIWQEDLLAADGGIFLTHDNASSRINWANQQFEVLGIKDRYYVAIPPLQPSEGDKGYGTTTIHYPLCREYYGIFTGVDEEKAARILDMFEFSFTPDGQQISWGIEDYNYYVDEEGIRRDKPEYTQKKTEKTLPYSEDVSGFFTNAITLEENKVRISNVVSPIDPTRYLVREAAALYEDGGYIDYNYMNIARKNDAETEEYNALYNDIKTKVDENLDQFIMGVKSMDDWEGFVAELKAMNIDRVLEIQNTALQRALNAGN
ncbi:MAG: hypothetical protein IJK56_06070 [Firmicutes bacterium]|nr:hypothetical protein [Bacillota bacterium]